MIVISTIVLALICSSIYFMFNGTPWGKLSYKALVQNYLKTNYPNLITSDIVVEYDFKNGKYYAHPTTDKGITFGIFLDYHGKLYDDYFTSVISTKVTNEVTDFVQKHYYMKSKTELNIEVSNDILLREYKQNILYSQLKPEHKSESKLFFYINSLYSGNSDLIQCYKIIQWLKEKDYEANLVFFFNDNSKIIIDYLNINEIMDEKDMIKFVYQ